ncbi:MAG TPA: hypothetical protein VN843_00445, partial [Anaerolineales bacterium]|nr:hypothetical protein [Anaerolineales bacterium]
MVVAVIGVDESVLVAVRVGPAAVGVPVSVCVKDGVSVIVGVKVWVAVSIGVKLGVIVGGTDCPSYAPISQLVLKGRASPRWSKLKGVLPQSFKLPGMALRAGLLRLT